MKIIWSVRAAKSFSASIDYISKDSSVAAQKWADRVFNKIEGLLEFPKIGKMQNFEMKGMRQLIIEKDYLAVYRYTQDKCIIVAFRNTKKNNW